MFHELNAIRRAAIASGPPLSCHSYLLGLITLSPSCSSYFVAFNDNILWRLNPFIVLCDLISEILVIIAQLLGKVTGRFVASLLNELPWIYQFPALILLTVSLLSSFVIFKRYNFRFLYGLVEILPDKLAPIPAAQGAVPPPVPPHRHLPIPYRRINSLKFHETIKF